MIISYLIFYKLFFKLIIINITTFNNDIQLNKIKKKREREELLDERRGVEEGLRGWGRDENLPLDLLLMINPTRSLDYLLMKPLKRILLMETIPTM